MAVRVDAQPRPPSPPGPPINGTRAIPPDGHPVGEQVESTHACDAGCDSGRYRANIESLARFQPNVAELVDGVTIPPDVRLVTGRDGCETFLLSTTESECCWLGGSSMPSVSVPEVLASFRSDGSNVALPGVLTGLEPLAVSRTCPPHVAVFVVEPDLLLIKLALHLYDYTGAFDSGRVVFLAGPDLRAALRAFFESHPGYELPRKLVTVPQASTQRIAGLQRALQVAGEVVVGVYAATLERCVAALKARPVQAWPSEPRVAVLGVDPRSTAIQHAVGVANGVAQLGWTHETCVPDDPSRCHTTARVEAIQRVGADLILFASGYADRLRSLLPDGTPLVAWYPPEGHVPSRVEVPPSRHDLTVVCSASQRDRLITAGIAADDIEVCGLAADETLFRPVSLDAEKRERWGTDVAVLADLPDDRPESCGVSLTSHLSLWHAMRDAVLEDPDGYQDERASECLAQAERNSGTTLDDAGTRDHFASLLTSRIAPACVARAQLGALLARRERVAVWGTNWPPREGGREFRRGMIPSGVELNELLNAARVVVLPMSGAGVVRLALCAMAVGTPVACRGDEDAMTRAYPGLDTLAPFFNCYRDRGELVEIVGRLLASDAGRPGTASPARQAVLAEHTFTKRVAHLADCIRLRRDQMIGDETASSEAV